MNFFLERGANLESRAAHTHPKNTHVTPGGLNRGLISTPNIAYIQLVYVYMYKCRRTLPHHSKKLATKPQTDLRLIGFFLASQYWCSRFSRFRDGPLEKLWGRAGEFSSRRNFFSLSNSLYEFFRP